MSKLSTGKIRELMKGWLSTPECKNNLHRIFISDDDNQDALDRFAGHSDLPSGMTAPELREHIWKLWCDVKQWKREEKHKLGEEYDTFIYNEGSPPVPYFAEDHAGSHDKELLKKYAADPAEAQNCVYRMFVPNNTLGSSFRLEVITTPADDAVIGWVITVD